MRVLLNFVLALILLIVVVHVQPNQAGRVLKMKQKLNLMSLDKGPVTPSGPSGCTYVPGSGGTNCHWKQMNVAGKAQQHHTDDETNYLVPFGVANHQHY
ncbi:hypothetical protein RJT34_23530 [Clitoria ternatea]|uniref:Uncharacterized protein n=1 Tax=Clitoria ternatea TaxID=43366 RepID=A0AAN9III4_CLITE